MKFEKVFPTLIIGLCACASVTYGIKGDIKQMIYWAACVVLYAVVTY